MKRFGPEKQVSKTEPLHLFHQRLYLLIIMLKARLKGYPVGPFRQAAVVENAQFLHRACSRIDISLSASDASVHLFKERVKLLCVMAKVLVSDEYPLGLYRRKAIMDNINAVAEASFPGRHLHLCHDILMAA